MSSDSTKKPDPNLEDINKAIKEFPNVIRDKERAFKAKEKVLKLFMKLAKELEELEKKSKKGIG